LAGKVSFARVAYRQSGEGEGLYPAGGLDYPRLVLLHPLAARVSREFTQSLGRDILITFATSFCEKMGPFFFWGDAPRSSPEGDLVFRGKPSRHFTLMIDGIYICTTNWGVGYVDNEKRLGNPF
jgi:hypothetical protein